MNNLIEHKTTIEKIRNFLEQEQNSGKTLFSYQSYSRKDVVLFESKIKIGLDAYKEIILEEEMGLELGGMNKKSFSLIIPVTNVSYINHGKITLLGKEVDNISEPSVDFGLIIIIGINNEAESIKEELKHLNFISNGIEGFSIRTIPRRFWCRISTSALQNGFSFEFLGKAIIYLYSTKFEDIVKSIEVIFINSYPNSIKQFIVLSSEILSEEKEKWKKKINTWRKRIDCDYDWGCEICPYRENCYNIKQILISREEI